MSLFFQVLIALVVAAVWLLLEDAGFLPERILRRDGPTATDAVIEIERATRTAEDAMRSLVAEPILPVGATPNEHAP